jgi:hypothetical protein
MKATLRVFGLFVILFLPSQTFGQLSVFADGVYHSSFFGPKLKIPKLFGKGVKLGMSFKKNETYKFDVAIGYSYFNKLNDVDVDYDKYSTTITYKYLYARPTNVYIEASLSLFILQKYIYLKFGPYIGTTHLKSDSGYVLTKPESYNSLVSIRHFNNFYSSGFDRGVMFGSGLDCFHKGKLSVNLEVMFRLGFIKATQTESVENTVEVDKKFVYWSYMPAIKLSYNLNKPTKK